MQILLKSACIIRMHSYARFHSKFLLHHQKLCRFFDLCLSLSLLFASNSQFSIASFICKIFFVLLIYQFKTNHRLLLQISPSSNNGNKKRQPRKLSCNNKHTMVSGWRNDNIRSKKSETIHSKSLLHMMIIITQKQYEIWEAIVI